MSAASRMLVTERVSGVAAIELSAFIILTDLIMWLTLVIAA